MNMNQVTLTVNNIQKTADFYRLMGFIQIVDSPHYARFECPDGHASFSLSLQPIEKQNNSVIYFEHQQLDQLVEQLIAKGIHFDQMPTMQSYLWREAVLRDPSGNKIKLYWAGENRLNPPWKVELT
ncbi:VOC family protein [Shewanella sp. VB17]|uniref:VOC family protein n=1 Tax=Shewanella sp. VB17 TaxID=2739432 RepID=UPI00156639B1|nr:VOC family protein [Shewanella sp. VB17]NRD72626.1 VOC family protein [Shewanella sp. VB17]